jgi:hypothetical protein
MRSITSRTVAGVAFSCLTGVAMAQVVPPPKDIPDLKGKWVETGERSGVVRRGNRWEHKSPPTNGEVVFGGPLTLNSPLTKCLFSRDDGPSACSR